MTFVKGQSGNPGGRPKGKIKQIAQAAREHADDVIEMLSTIVTDEGAANKDRIAAGKELLDRGIGKALALNANVTTGPLDDMNEDELLELLSAIRAIKADLTGDGGGGAGEASEVAAQA